MFYHVAAARNGRYVVDTWRGGTLADWSDRRSMPTESLPGSLDVGDVFAIDGSLRSVRSRRADPDVWRVDESTANAVRSAYGSFNDVLGEHADALGIPFERDSESLTDGDVLFAVTPPGGGTDPVRGNDTASVCPDGLYADGQDLATSVSRLLNPPSLPLASGSTFHVLELDEVDGFDAPAAAQDLAVHDDTIELTDVAFALRFDAATTIDVQGRPALVHLFGPDVFEYNDHVDSKADLEPPVYASFDEFDDGRYAVSLYDAASPPPEGFFENYRFVLDGVNAHPPYRIAHDWTARNRLVPVTDIVLGSSEHPDAPVAVISSDADAIEAAYTWD